MACIQLCVLSVFKEDFPFCRLLYPHQAYHRRLPRRHSDDRHLRQSMILSQELSHTMARLMYWSSMQICRHLHLTFLSAGTDLFHASRIHFYEIIEMEFSLACFELSHYISLNFSLIFFGSFMNPNFNLIDYVRRILKQKNAAKFTGYVLKLVLNDFFRPVLFRLKRQIQRIIGICF